MAETKIDLDSQTKGTLPPDRGGTGVGSPFTQGSVLFAGASAFDQNNAKLFWDNASYRLGIGTAVPAANLHVVGPVRFGGVGPGLLDWSTTSGGNTTNLTLSAGAENAQSMLTLLSGDTGSHVTMSIGRAGVESYIGIATAGAYLSESAAGDLIIAGVGQAILFGSTAGGSAALAIEAGNASVHLRVPIKISDGSQQAGYVLTSDADGVGTWQAAGGGGGGVTGSGVAGQVAYWSGTSALTGSTSLTFSPAAGLSISLPASATPGTISLVAGANNTSGAGGQISLTGGNSIGAFSGGDVVLTGGNTAIASGNQPGSIRLLAGGNDVGSSGSKIVIANALTITGSAQAGQDVTVTFPGTNDTGRIFLNAGYPNGSIQLSTGIVALTINSAGKATFNGAVDINGAVKIADGTQSNGYVLTSDASGNASWGPAGGGSNPFAGTGSFVVTNTYKMNTGSPSYQPERAESMVYDGTYLWMGNDSQNSLRKVDANGALIARYTFPESIHSLVYAFGYLWAACNSLNLYKVDTSTGSIVKTYIAGRVMRHLTANATHLYASGDSDPVVYQFDPGTEEFNNLFEQAETTSPDSIVTDGGGVAWIIDQSSSNINRVQRDPVYATLGVFNIAFTAIAEGTAGNNVTIKFEFKGSGLPDVAVTGNDIVITVFNSSGSAREYQIANAVNAHAQAKLLVRAFAGSPNSIHNYNQNPYNTVQNLAGGTDHLLGTTDVSASGLPWAGALANGFLWVTMNNGDLLKIDPGADTVLATFPSGSPALRGIVADSYFLYVADPSPQCVHAFDFTAEYFVDSFQAANPQDIVWDGAEQIFAINHASGVIRRHDRKSGSLLGTINVSASGTPRRGVWANGKLWVCMSNGDLLQIDGVTETVDNTYPSGQTELEGITRGNGSTLYVSDPTAKYIIPFDLGGFAFGTPVDVSAIATPNDIAYDASASIWLLDRSSTTITRVYTDGTPQSTIDVSADGGLPLRMSPTQQSGLMVVMDNSHLLFCDAYGAGNISRTIDFSTQLVNGNLVVLSGIDSDGSNNTYMSSNDIGSGNDMVFRFFNDGGAFYGSIIQTIPVANAADRIKIANVSFWTSAAADTNIRQVDHVTGATLFTVDTSAYGQPMDLVTGGNTVYATLDTGDMLSVNTGYEQAVASLVMGDLTHTANGPGSTGNAFNVELTGGNTLGQATVTVYDGTRLVVDIESGVTTAQTLYDAILASTGNGSFTTTISGSASNPQVTTAQTFFSGGGSINPAVITSVPSGKSALAGMSEYSNWSPTGPLVGFTSPSPSNGYLHFIGSGFFYTGLSIPGYYPSRMYADATDVWVCDSSGNTDGSFRIDIASMEVVAHITGIFNGNSYPNNVIGHGGYIYFTNWNYPIVHKIDPATNTEILRVFVGDQVGGNNYAWCLGIHPVGSDLYVSSIGGGSNQSNVMLDKLVGDRIIASTILGNAPNNNDVDPMVLIGDTLFVSDGYSLYKVNTNLG